MTDSKPRFVPLVRDPAPDTDELIERSLAFREAVSKRRTVRHFSAKPVPRSVIENAIAAAGTAPSGANLQPWHFAAVSDPSVKHKIRIAAEEEEKEFYEHRAPKEWLDALAPLGTDSEKPFLEIAPWLIAIFVQKHGTLPDGQKVKHYYPNESVGIATGILITALHTAGLATLTHTPSPMGFLNEILERPKNERPFLLLVTGYAADDAEVPDIERKPLDSISTFR